ncbi:MAG: hypothetical protein JWQ81_8474 [Amycolatopsis sp.]|nr:hypothetical protein [Amycolatopsis sp.]
MASRPTRPTTVLPGGSRFLTHPDPFQRWDGFRATCPNRPSSGWLLNVGRLVVAPLSGQPTRGRRTASGRRGDAPVAAPAWSHASRTQHAPELQAVNRRVEGAEHVSPVPREDVDLL